MRHERFTEVRFNADGAGGVVVGADGGERPAVLLTTAIAGVNDYVLRQAGRLADAGYAVAVLDYYAREGGQAPDLSSPEKIMTAVGALADETVMGDMADAVAWLKEQPGVTRVGALGFCIGGTYALLAASRVPGLSCAVTFYGMLRYGKLSDNKPVSPIDAAEKVGCPFLGHFGETDHLVPVADARELADRLRGRPAEIYTYPGAGHAFHEDFRPEVYRPVAATAAWARTHEYLRYYLGEGA
ncbi:MULTISPECIES: dienelactone hydrolase family protein [Actinomadura]|jgi:carboxymethylenebutenolidase|uniref:Dienelactone hydrolase family protein n=1 Tax=Actinomadura geliboluensis TaxID=882440 RepID=A0A5S4HAS9_9ACTN|nr:dienelactone hydrolase family protein [Actinomadura geliboluensis]TMR42358.1 dienelactone hydrolase family protein [Actinomadura geliboluensis]